MKGKNWFSEVGDTLTIGRYDSETCVNTTIRADYISEIKNATWHFSSGYLKNNRLGYLHRYIMGKWYTEELLNEMTKADYVVDHMDGDKTNCCIDNLSFLSSRENKAKGFMLDQVNKDKMHLALSLFKDFETQLYQITIVFNYPASLIDERVDEAAYIELAYFLYDDYSTMILDCEQLRNEYYKSYTFTPGFLRCIDYHIEGTYGNMLPVSEYDNFMRDPSPQGIVFFEKRAYIKGWTRETKEEFFHIREKYKRNGE